MDAPSCQRESLLLAREGCEYTIAVSFWNWVAVKAHVAAQRQWERVDTQEGT